MWSTIWMWSPFSQEVDAVSDIDSIGSCTSSPHCACIREVSLQRLSVSQLSLSHQGSQECFYIRSPFLKKVIPKWLFIMGQIWSKLKYLIFHFCFATCSILFWLARQGAIGFAGCVCHSSRHCSVRQQSLDAVVLHFPGKPTPIEICWPRKPCLLICKLFHPS